MALQARTLAVSSAMRDGARIFRGAYTKFGDLLAVVASLDALAALAEATHPSNAPPGTMGPISHM